MFYRNVLLGRAFVESSLGGFGGSLVATGKTFPVELTYLVTYLTSELLTVTPTYSGSRKCPLLVSRLLVFNKSLLSILFAIVMNALQTLSKDIVLVVDDLNCNFFSTIISAMAYPTLST